MPSFFGPQQPKKRRVAAIAGAVVGAVVLHAAGLGWLLSIAETEPEPTPDVEEIEIRFTFVHKKDVLQKDPSFEKTEVAPESILEEQPEKTFERKLHKKTSVERQAQRRRQNPQSLKKALAKIESSAADSELSRPPLRSGESDADRKENVEAFKKPPRVVDEALSSRTKDEETGTREPKNLAEDPPATGQRSAKKNTRLGPRPKKKESLLEQVLQRKEPAPLEDPLDMTPKKIWSALQPLPDFTLSTKERLRLTTENRLNELFEVKANPADELAGKRILEPTHRLGYRWVDEKTGLPPEKAPAPKMAGLARSSTGGITFKDKERPLSNQTRDDLVPTDDGGFFYDRGAWKAKIFADGSIAFDENIGSFSTGERPPPIYEKLGIPAADLTSISFDATDIIMRLAGMDPYAEAKRCFLDDVAPIRDELRSKWQSEKLGDAVAALRARLDRLWNENDRPIRQRRRAIFEIFDGCNDEQAGKVARRVIFSWIRLRIPSSSLDAFTLAELQLFAQERHEEPAFLPYGPLPIQTSPSLK